MNQRINLNEDTAYLIGLHIGDGTLYKTSRGIVWELRGGLDEQEYYKKEISQLIKRIFQLELKPKFRSGRKNGCFGVQTSKKQITQFFLDAGFEAKSKTKTASIPEYTKRSSKEIKSALIRGLFDTDGCLRFDKINNEKYHRYPRIEFCSASKRLNIGLKILLKELGFKPFTWEDKEYYKLCLAGESSLSKFMKDINPKNHKYWLKYNTWKSLRYYPMH